MNRMTKIALATAVSGTALSSAAFAGNLDEPVAEAPVTTPAPAPVTYNDDWTGFYGGLNLGYADIDGDGAADGDDTTYGVHAGYDYDFGNYIVGGEIEYDKLDVDLNGAAEAEDVIRLKVKGGYDLGSTMVYATAGSAMLDTDIGGDTGQFIGVGATYKVNERFTVGGELLEHRFDDIGGSAVDADATTFNVRGSIRF